MALNSSVKIIEKEASSDKIALLSKLNQLLEADGIVKISIKTGQSNSGIATYFALPENDTDSEFFSLESAEGRTMLQKIIEKQAQLLYKVVIEEKPIEKTTDDLLEQLVTSDQQMYVSEQAPAEIVFNENDEKDITSAISSLLSIHYFRDILNAVSKINIREFGKLQDNVNLNNQMKIVLVTDCVIDVARKFDVPLIRYQNSFYIYNGKFYQKLSEDDLRIFLGQAAFKLGIEDYQAKLYSFRDCLFKQFYSSAYFRTPEKKSFETKINLQNGVFRVSPQGQELIPHSPDEFFTYILPFEFNKDATCPKWQSFLDEVLPDKCKQLILAEYFGSCFISNKVLKLEKALILFGDGANGKSVCFDVVSAIFGRENISNFMLSSLCDDKGYHRAELTGKLLNYSSEISSKMNTTMFKALVSGEPTEARRPYGAAFIQEEIPKLAFNTNVLPKDTESNTGFFRRFLIIHFDQKVPPEKRNPKLAKEIIDNESAGVFNWILEGLKRVLAQKGFSECNAVDDALETYKRNSESVLLFIDDSNLKPSATITLPLKDMYGEYKSYCRDNGYIACSIKSFSDRLSSNGFTIVRKNFGRVVYVEANV